MCIRAYAPQATFRSEQNEMASRPISLHLDAVRQPGEATKTPPCYHIHARTTRVATARISKVLKGGIMLKV